jgi:hypothetical protein
MVTTWQRRNDMPQTDDADAFDRFMQYRQGWQTAFSHTALMNVVNDTVHRIEGSGYGDIVFVRHAGLDVVHGEPDQD